MTDREKRERLLDIMRDARNRSLTSHNVMDHDLGLLVDALLANGVTLPKPKFIRPPADLTGKCGSCIYSKPYEGESRTFKSFVECTNKEHLRKWCKGNNAKYRQKTAHACKCYQTRREAI